MIIKEYILYMYKLKKCVIIIDWSERKSLSNLKKHGVSFAEASTVFFDEAAKLIYDPDHSIDEDRFILIGISASNQIFLVVHTYKDDDSIRLISARLATRNETITIGKNDER